MLIWWGGTPILGHGREVTQTVTLTIFYSKTTTIMMG